jgi:hypothetical protein
MGIDTERCEFQVQQSDTERKRDKKICEREVHKLTLQLNQLQESTGLEAAALKEQVSVLEVEKVALIQARKKGMQILSLTLSLIQTLTLTKTRFPRLMLHRVETNGD